MYSVFSSTPEEDNFLCDGLCHTEEMAKNLAAHLVGRGRSIHVYRMDLIQNYTPEEIDPKP